MTNIVAQTKSPTKLSLQHYNELCSILNWLNMYGYIFFMVGIYATYKMKNKNNKNKNCWECKLDGV